MHDTEFKVEEHIRYMMQTRNAKRPAQAAVPRARWSQGPIPVDF